MRVGTSAVLGAIVVLVVTVMIPAEGEAQKPRARDLGIPFTGLTGAENAITDVPGVKVGHTTIVRGEGRLEKGQGPVRTGVTAILPRGHQFGPVYAATYALNGNGEMTGIHWMEESGFLETPILITNTFSVGVVRDAVIAWMDSTGFNADPEGDRWYTYPVVAETYDVLNDILGQHVTPRHAFAALDGAADGPVPEGNVGGGTGMIAHGFKGGIGTASRLTGEGYTLGVLVQANHGDRIRFTVAGVPVGQEIPDQLPEYVAEPRGSIIVVLATDAPLLPHQLQRLAERVPLGIGRIGGLGENSSGDIFIAFSTGNTDARERYPHAELRALPNDALDDFFRATVEATEEAILNAMVAAETMTGADNLTAYALPVERMQEVLKRYDRFVDPETLPRVASRSAESLEALAGTYRYTDSDTTRRLYVEDGKLFFDRGSNNRSWLVPLTDNRFQFVDQEYAVYLEPLPEAAGQVQRLRITPEATAPLILERVDDPG